MTGRRSYRFVNGLDPSIPTSINKGVGHLENELKGMIGDFYTEKVDTLTNER